LHAIHREGVIAMARYVMRRVLQALTVLLGALILSFVLLRVVPGDPAVLMLPETATPAEIQQMRHSLGVDQPAYAQFGLYVKQVLTGDFGISFRRQAPALPLTLRYLPATFLLAGASLALTILIAIPMGILAALRHNGWLDSLVGVVALLGQSMPTYWLGMILILIFAVQFRVLPTSGFGEPRHLLLPAVTLAFSQVALVTRLMRSSLLEVIRQDYVRTARAKGLSQRVIIFKHALKNALIPVVTVLGLQVGNLLGGAIITETVFAWPGAGSLLVSSIGYRDYPVVQVMVLISAVVFVVINLIVDLGYVLLDPRIAYD
jgi:peptide/nickel transport system permease protein